MAEFHGLPAPNGACALYSLMLSFGPRGQDIDLKSLNALIGPNGSGKSSLIEVFALLRAAPGKLQMLIGVQN